MHSPDFYRLFVVRMSNRFLEQRRRRQQQQLQLLLLQLQQQQQQLLLPLQQLQPLHHQQLSQKVKKNPVMKL